MEETIKLTFLSINGDTMWRCTHNQHLCRRFKCYIGGQAFYTLEIATVLFYNIAVRRSILLIVK